MGLFPMLKPNIEIPKAGERGDIGFVEMQNLFEMLNRFFEALGFFEIARKGKEDLDVLLVETPRPSMKPNRLIEIFLDPLNFPQPQEGADMIRIQRQDLLEKKGGIPIAFSEKGVDRFGIVGLDLGLFLLQAGIFPIQEKISRLANPGGEDDQESAESGGEEDQRRHRHFERGLAGNEEGDPFRVELGKVADDADKSEDDQDDAGRCLPRSPFSFLFALRAFHFSGGKGHLRGVSPEAIEVIKFPRFLLRSEERRVVVIDEDPETRLAAFNSE